jgi:hypothetical protein
MGLNPVGCVRSAECNKRRKGAPVAVTVSADNVEQKADFPINATQSALGVYEFEFDPADLARKDQIHLAAIR